MEQPVNGEFKGTVNVRLDHLEARIEKMEMRQSAVEKTLWRVGGGLAVLLVLLDAVSKWFIR